MIAAATSLMKASDPEEDGEVLPEDAEEETLEIDEAEGSVHQFAKHASVSFFWTKFTIMILLGYYHPHHFTWLLSPLMFLLTIHTIASNEILLSTAWPMRYLYDTCPFLCR